MSKPCWDRISDSRLIRTAAKIAAASTAAARGAETDIRIAQDKSGVKVAADRFDSRMQTLPREDFPTLPETGGASSALLPRNAVKEMVAKTQFAITGEDTRYFLNGAQFVLRADSMSLVATDGHRLALVRPQRRAHVGQPRAHALQDEDLRL